MRDGVVIERFNQIYYDLGLWQSVRWLGVPLLKYPTDLFLYAELMQEISPDVIIECGTYCGGSAWFLATICDLLQRGRIITIDPHDPCEQRSNGPPCRPQHPRINYLRGGSTHPDTIAKVKGLIAAGERVMVILDSDHSMQHVVAELDAYAPLVTPGCYVIVEDTNLNGRPVVPTHGPGPGEAVDVWLPQNCNFTRDPRQDRLLLSANPGGYLRKESE